MPEVVAPIIWFQMQQDRKPLPPSHVVEPMGMPSTFGIVAAAIVVIVMLVCLWINRDKR